MTAMPRTESPAKDIFSQMCVAVELVLFGLFLQPVLILSLVAQGSHVRRSVSGGSGRPSTSAVQRSPLSVKCPAVSVPELTISPELNGWLGKRRIMAAPSSARQKAGLRRLFLPDPSSTNSPFFDILTLNRAS